jgi:hypothetical protein
MRRAPRKDVRRILGLSFVVFGFVIILVSAVSAATSLGGLGLASFLIGMLLVYLPSQTTSFQDIVKGYVLSSLINTERSICELASNTKAVYLTVHDRLEKPMILLPMGESYSDTSQIGIQTESRLLLLDPSDVHKTGLLLEAPGASLLELVEKESGVDFFDLDRNDLIDSLRSSMVNSLELVNDLTGTIAKRELTFVIKDGPLTDLTLSVLRSAPTLSSRLGCLICSAAICAAIKSFKCAMTVENVTHKPKLHQVTLRFDQEADEERE